MNDILDEFDRDKPPIKYKPTNKLLKTYAKLEIGFSRLNARRPRWLKELRAAAARKGRGRMI